MAGQREKNVDRKVAAKPFFLSTQAADPADQSSGQRKYRREKCVLDGRVFLLADVHQKRQKRRGTETAAERFEHRRAVEAKAAEIEPLHQGVAEIGYRLKQTEKPHPVKYAVARNKRAT